MQTQSIILLSEDVEDIHIPITYSIVYLLLSKEKEESLCFYYSCNHGQKKVFVLWNASNGSNLYFCITIIRHLPQVFTCGNQPKEYYLFRYERDYNKITFTRVLVFLIDPRKVRVSTQLSISGGHCHCTGRVLPISLSYFKVSHSRVQARYILRGRHIPRHLSW